MLSTYTPATYVANVGTLVFAIPWPYQNTTHIKPYLDGLLLTAGFTVSPAGASGTVTFSVDPRGTSIVFIRELPIDQPTDFQNQGSFSGKRHEDTYDREVMQIAQVNEKLNRTIVAEVGSTLNPLPSAAVRANKYFAFDSNGNVTVAANLTPSALVKTVSTSAPSGIPNQGDEWVQYVP